MPRLGEVIQTKLETKPVKLHCPFRKQIVENDKRDQLETFYATKNITSNKKCVVLLSGGSLTAFPGSILPRLIHSKKPHGLSVIVSHTDFGRFNFPRGLEQSVQDTGCSPALGQTLGQVWQVAKRLLPREQRAIPRNGVPPRLLTSCSPLTPSGQMKWIQLSSHSLGTFRG